MPFAELAAALRTQTVSLRNGFDFSFHWTYYAFIMHLYDQLSYLKNYCTDEKALKGNRAIQSQLVRRVDPISSTNLFKIILLLKI